MSDRRPFEFAPAGARWPWLPLYTCEVEVKYNAEGATLHAVTPVKKGRIGLRRWIRHGIKWKLPDAP